MRLPIGPQPLRVRGGGDHRQAVLDRVAEEDGRGALAALARDLGHELTPADVDAKHQTPKAQRQTTIAQMRTFKSKI